MYFGILLNCYFEPAYLPMLNWHGSREGKQELFYAWPYFLILLFLVNNLYVQPSAYFKQRLEEMEETVFPSYCQSGPLEEMEEPVFLQATANRDPLAIFRKARIWLRLSYWLRWSDLNLIWRNFENSFFSSFLVFYCT